jgi:lysophospholipase L1-like esterase
MNRLIAARGHVRLSGAVALLAVLVLAFPVAAAPSAPYPNSIASTGDSITRAYNTGTFPYSDNPSASWSTGTNSTVASLYSRLLALNPAISGKTYHDSKSGAKMADLAGQMSTVATQKPDVVTVLMGGNDLCTSSEAAMTSTASFEAAFRAAMAAITAGSPSTKVYVASIPSIYRLWQTLKGNSSARTIWSLFGVCKSMLANPTSTAQADVDRRTRVNQREVDFNTILKTVCAAYAQCRTDNGAVFNFVFPAADISTRDYFHPSLAGQKDLAQVTWAAGYWGP